MTDPMGQSVSPESLTTFSAAALLALPGNVSAISRSRKVRLKPRRQADVRVSAPQAWTANEG